MTIFPFPVCVYAAIHYKMEDDCTLLYLSMSCADISLLKKCDRQTDRQTDTHTHTDTQEWL